MKKQVYVTLLLALVISVLPGCGKGKNNSSGSVIGGIPGFAGFNGVVGNGCMNVGPVAAGTPISFPITGQAQIGLTGFSSNATVGGAGYTGGNYYIRQNSYGDTINLILSGAANSTGQVNATVNLSAQTVTAIGANLQSVCIQGISFMNVGVSAGSPGTIYGPMYMYVNGSAVVM